MNSKPAMRICAVLALIFSLHAWADNDNPAGAGGPQDEQPALIYTWIQDPWTGDTELTTVREPDQSLWNGQRIKDYEESLEIEASPALGTLTIEKLNLQVPVYNGADEFNLNRGLGRIKGTARPNEDGNLGISGHRDGFFRTLKDIQKGDEILLHTPAGVETYAVSSITIVPKHDVSVLDPTDDKTLTVVTCYPFYFVGHAPKRYIVKAHPVED
jgi:sortase A